MQLKNPEGRRPPPLRQVLRGRYGVYMAIEKSNKNNEKRLSQPAHRASIPNTRKVKKEEAGAKQVGVTLDKQCCVNLTETVI